MKRLKTWRFLLKLISILFRFLFFISNMQLKCHKHTHLLARYLFPTIWKFFKDFAILLLHPMQFSMGRNRVMNELCALFAASWALSKFPDFRQKTAKEPMVSTSSLSLSLFLLCLNLLYVIPVSAWFFLRILSLFLPPPRVRMTVVLEDRKLVDANASVYLPYNNLDDQISRLLNDCARSPSWWWCLHESVED